MEAPLVTPIEVALEDVEAQIDAEVASSITLTKAIKTYPWKRRVRSEGEE